MEKDVLTIENGVVTACDKEAVNVVIPDGVTAIASYAFCACEKLQSVYIPESVTNIDWYAFWECNSLSTVTLSDNLQKFDATGLSGIPADCKIVCSEGSPAYNAVRRKPTLRAHIKTFAIEDAKTEKIKQVQQVSVDAYIKSLLENVDDSSFEIVASKKDSTNVLISVGGNNGVFKLGKDFAKWLAKIGEAIKILSDKTKSAVDIYAELEKTKLPFSEISAEKVENGLTLKVDRRKILRLFCKGTLRRCLPDTVQTVELFGVTKFDKWAFDGCTQLRSISIPDCVPKLPLRAFARCKSLKSLEIPVSVTEIGELVFWSCNALESISFGGTVAKWNAVKKSDSWNEGCPIKTVKCSDGDVAL